MSPRIRITHGMDCLAKMNKTLLNLYSRMNISPVIITCPGRESALAATLESWQETDFYRVKPLIQLDQGYGERRERQTNNARIALCRALIELPSVDFILFMEDDLAFNRHLKANLTTWTPLLDSMEVNRAQARGGYFFGSLYNPNIREQLVRDDYFVADPTAVYGSQCFVLSSSMAREILDHWEDEDGMQDIRMSRIAARYGSIYYHRPSLVQHVGALSTWGGSFHQCHDFDKEFLRKPSLVAPLHWSLAIGN